MKKIENELENIKNNFKSIHGKQTEKRNEFLKRPGLQKQRAVILAEMNMAEQLFSKNWEMVKR